MSEVERVWVLDDPRAGTADQAIGIAERIGEPFRRIPLTWNRLAHVVALSPRGSLAGLAAAVPALETEPGPTLTLSSGSRSAAVALWLKDRFGSLLVHSMRPGLRAGAFDLLVLPGHDRAPGGARVFRVLGAPNRLSPLALHDAERAWSERLAHLPRPRIALLVGGSVGGPAGANLTPVMAHALGRHVAQLVQARGGSVMATTSRRTGGEATEALSAGLASAMHLLFRWGEPGENPYRGFLATADAVVVTADSVSMLSEACATAAPVFWALPQLAGARQRRLLATLLQAGQARMLEADLSPWPRTPLDEAARVAAEIRKMLPPE